MCKLMAASAAYCEQNLQLLFSVMIGAPEAEIRSNIVVALGDLTFRWTNLTEPWMSHIYALLHDKDTQVRRHTLTRDAVLLELILIGGADRRPTKRSTQMTLTRRTRDADT